LFLLFHFQLALKKYISYKGSICIDGISLTVSKLSDLIFNISVIPFTYNETNLKYKRVGDIVNIEIDVIARYIEVLMNKESNSFLNLIKDS